MAEISMIGQPNVRERRPDNPIAIPGILSYLVKGSFHGNVRGLEDLPVETSWGSPFRAIIWRFLVCGG